MSFDIISNINLNLDPDDADGWVNVLAKILDESVNANSSERSQLITLITKVVKATGISLRPLDEIALRLQANLALANLTQRLNELDSRNQELLDLASQLNVQVATANRDAGRFTRITDEIKKVTASITTIKDLVGQLSNPDATTVARIEAVITALERLN
jgi:hypothetical protein